MCRGGNVHPRRRSLSAEIREQEVVVHVVRAVVVQRDLVVLVCQPLPLRRPRGVQRRSQMEVALHRELHHQQQSQEFVSGAVGGVGDLAREDVSEAEEALRQVVVCAAEVEEGEDDGLEGCRGREGGEVLGEVFPHLGLARRGLVLFAKRIEPALHHPSQPRPHAGKHATRQVRQQDAPRDIRRAAPDGGQLAIAPIDLHEVAVLLAEGAVPRKRRQRKVEQARKRAELRAEGVGGARAADLAVEVAEGLREAAGEVGVFLMCADDVRGRGEGEWGGAERCGGGGHGELMVGAQWRPYRRGK